MARNLIIHIGTHKTGTTSVQSFLYKKKNLLKNNSIFYPPLVASKINAGHHFVGRIIAEKRSGNLVKKNPKFAELIQQIKSSNCELAVISSELISLVDPAIVAEVFAEFDCQIVCVLRRQDNFLESMYRELKKHSYFSGDKHNFIDIITQGKELIFFTDGSIKISGILPFNYEHFLDKWANSFGADKIHAYAYDDPKIEGNALKAVLEVIGLEHVNPKTQKFNSSFQPELIQIRDVIDKKMSFKAQLALRPAFWWANENFESSEKTYLFDTKDRSKIMAMVAESNSRTATTYLRGLKIPWLNKNCEIDHKPATPELDMNTALQSMSLLIAHQAQQILKLKEEIAEIRSLIK